MFDPHNYQWSPHSGHFNLAFSCSLDRDAGADPGFDQGGPQIVTGLKLPFWGLSFVEFWCWGLIFGGQGGARAPGPPPPGSAPGMTLDRNFKSYMYS